MPRRVIECRILLPETKCSVILVGEEEEVVRAYRAHVAADHGGALKGDALLPEGALQAAVFDGGKSAYIGDRYKQTGTNLIQIQGPGFLFRRIGDVGGIEMDCHCLAGDGRCNLVITGPFAQCSEGTCTDCTFKTTVPRPAGAGDWVVTPP